MIQRIKSLFLIQQRGQTLIEVLVALSILGVVITVITSIIINSLNNVQHGKDQFMATKYAQDGVEFVRTVRDADYTGFKNYSGTYCFGKNQGALGVSAGNCTTPNVNSFIRSVVVEQTPGCGTNVAKVTVVVTWTDSKCVNNTYCHKSEQVSCLSTVEPVQAP